MGKGAKVTEDSAAQNIVEPGRVWGNLLQRKFWRKLLEKWFQCRLGGGAEHGRSVAVPYQLCNGTAARFQIIQRQGLRFIKNDHAVGQVVQLAATAAAVGVQRLKKLYGCGHHNGGVPVFAGQQLTVLRRGQVLPF